jgi:uncharacterized protein involved in outer membrane biogenesis
MRLRRRKRTNWSKVIGLTLTTVFLLALVLPFILPLKPWFPNLEAQLSQALGEPVRIDNLHAGLLPRPYLEATGISIGKDRDVTMARARLYPDLLTLREPTRFIKSTDVDDVTVSRAAVVRFLGEHTREGGVQALRFGRIHATHLKLALFDGKIGDLEVDAALGRDNQLINMSLATFDQRTRLELTPTPGGTQVAFSAQDWKPWTGPQLPFDRVSLQATLSEGRLAVSEFTAGIYGGDIRGGLELGWGDAWTLSGRAQLSRMEARSLLQALQMELPVRGTLDTELRFNATAPAPAALLDGMKFEGKFKLSNGVLSDFDFSRVIQGAGRDGMRGGQTRFELLTGNIQTGGGYRFTGLRLSSGMLSVAGNMAVAPGGQLSGVMNVELRATAALLGSTVVTGGSLQEPVLLPAK